LPLLSPVNDQGCFTEEAGPLLVGLDVLVNGTTKVSATILHYFCY